MKQQNFLLTLSTFLFLSLLVFLLSQKNLLFGQGVFGNSLFGIQAGFYSLIHMPFSSSPTSQLHQLQQENKDLLTKLSQLQSVQADEKALRDQFQTPDIPIQTLIPAAVIGAPSFLPGISLPDTLVLYLGKDEGISVGQTVVYKNVYIGSISQTVGRASLVQLITSTSSFITATDQVTGALGIIKGQGQEQMILDNVSLSDQIKIGDIVVTSPGKNLEGKGYQPGLLLGTISSVEKNPSSLFQKAHIKPLYQVEKLPIVFIIK